MKFNLELLENYMKENKLSKTGFCKKCGISYSVLLKILDNNTNKGSRHIVKIVKVLNVKIAEFMI